MEGKIPNAFIVLIIKMISEILFMIVPSLFHVSARKTQAGKRWLMSVWVSG